MRKTIERQQSLAQPLIDHEHARELAAISDTLDKIPHVLERVVADITCGKRTNRGRRGMTAEQVLRVFIIKQMHGFSYDELAFQLASNSCYQAFCRIGIGDRPPKRSTLQHNLKRLSSETMNEVHVAILEQARSSGVENGSKVRVDCTNTETNIHEPTDSSLLWDTIRVLSRLMSRAKDEFNVVFSNHTRRAKRRLMGILHAGTAKKRVPQYRDLLKVAKKVMADGERVAGELQNTPIHDLNKALVADGIVAQLRHFVRLGKQVVDQTRRRVLENESVPVGDKIVSIFETHTDILVKGRRQTEYGHKLCIVSGASSMILDCEVTKGNPADSKLATGMIERHIECYGEAPRQAAFDGGFASRTNVTELKELGVNDVAFSKRCGLAITDMVKSSWVYKRLRNFRAGVEGVISFFKRGFGGDRCTWRGLRSFKTYIWGSIVACNLLILARHQLAT